MDKFADFDEYGDSFNRGVKRNECDLNGSDFVDKVNDILRNDGVGGFECVADGGEIDDDYRWFLTYFSNVAFADHDAVDAVDEEEEEVEVEEEKEKEEVEVEEVEVEGEEEEEEDPHFRMFLGNLRGDGKSFVAKVRSDGELGFMKYEEEVVVAGEGSESDGENRRKRKEGMRRGKFEKRKRSGRGEEEVESLSGERNGLGRCDDEGVDGNREKVSSDVGNEEEEGRTGLGKEKEGSGDVRSEKMEGRKGLGKYSKSLVGKEKRNVGVSREDNVDDRSVSGKDEKRLKVGRNLRSDDENGRLTSGRSLASFMDEEKIEGMVGNSVSGHNVERSMPRKEKSTGENESRSTASGGNARSGSRKDNKMDDADIDPCFKLFLNSCVTEGDSVVALYNGMRLKFEEDDAGSSSDSDVMVLDKSPDCMQQNYTPIRDSEAPNAPLEENVLQYLGGRSVVENLNFREELMDILRRPYDKKEYKKLSKDVKFRKPIERHVELRSATKRYSTDTMGKSYLDYFVDMARQLRAFKHDRPKKLNILRGFFYYLKNMSNDGKFKPWLDESCLAIKPRRE